MLTAHVPRVTVDTNVEAVREKLRSRSEAGVRKYGVTTDRGDLDMIQWLTHLQEELMDAAVYLEAAMSKLRSGGHDAQVK